MNPTKVVGENFGMPEKKKKLEEEKENKSLKFLRFVFEYFSCHRRCNNYDHFLAYIQEEN